MIFHRWALQRRLTELRAILDDVMIDKLAGRLNRPGKDRIAAMWELVVLHGFATLGSLQSEVVLASNRRPDILFNQQNMRITADVTAVSNEGLDQDNPYHELSQLIEVAKNKLGLPIGGVDLRVRSKLETTKRGKRTILRLPPREKLQEFVNKRILPSLRAQVTIGKYPLSVVIDDHNVGLEITIDPSASAYSSGSFAAYDVPTIKDRNPLYQALKAKAEQLRGADGLTGIVVGDADCIALSGRSTDGGGLSTNMIVEEFFRLYSSVDFVALLNVRISAPGLLHFMQSIHQNQLALFVRDGCNYSGELRELIDAVVGDFPKPAMMPVNGAYRARKKDYDLGRHGGY